MTPRTTHTAPRVGESWAYRASASDPLVEVGITRIGVRTPARVLIRFVDEQFEGRQDWVPPARLKVPWSNAGEYSARETRWQAVIATSPTARTPADYATSYVFTTLIDSALATTDISGAAGVSLIHDQAGLAAFLELDPQLLLAEKLAFCEDGALVVPWSITELIATTAARANPDPLLHHAQAREADYRNKTMHGEYHDPRGQDRAVHIPAEWFVQELGAAHNEPYWNLLRSWAGFDNTQHYDNLKRLRHELARTTAIAHDAIAALREQGSVRIANRFERLLKEHPRPTARPDRD
ncbi:hypothetical protein [uncultured Jatrophihabitans sp.]|uniref:hypothetical protein n=1 Tax=uncultured Jatrophihabitans sp. TaxID=1610747 RepID=UPI0035CA5AE7